ncbi:MAG: NAD-dependent epimerase/dehydratase family protein [Deltaproteobacteria bacterium]|nr:NAD-dependent epimerase/dehydratase family protein [Deltaproteobacteria bacterium]
MKILVTGGAGFIGSNLVELLIEKHHEVFVVDNLSTGRQDNLPKGVPIEVMDVRDTRLIDLVAGIGPKVVIHLAAQIDVRKSVADPVTDADINVLGTLMVARASAAAGVSRLLFASSGGAVYGEQEVFPAPEEHRMIPRSPYGISKMASEYYLACLNEEAGSAAPCFLRLANVYGPRQDPFGEAGVVAIFSNNLLSGRRATIFGDGLQTRDFVYVMDVARAFLAAMESEYVGPVNVGTGIETSVSDLYWMMAGFCETDLAPVMAPAKPGEQRRSSVDPSLAMKLWGFKPKTTLESGLKKTIEYFKGVRSR